MFYYLGNIVLKNTTDAYLIDREPILMSDMGKTPYTLYYYKGEMLPRTSKTLCQETGGDCFKFANKYLKT
jgi:hypothetical protein